MAIAESRAGPRRRAPAGSRAKPRSSASGARALSAATADQRLRFADSRRRASRACDLYRGRGGARSSSEAVDGRSGLDHLVESNWEDGWRRSVRPRPPPGPGRDYRGHPKILGTLFENTELERSSALRGRDLGSSGPEKRLPREGMLSALKLAAAGGQLPNTPPHRSGGRPRPYWRRVLDEGEDVELTW